MIAETAVHSVQIAETVMASRFGVYPFNIDI